MDMVGFFLYLNKYLVYFIHVKTEEGHERCFSSQMRQEIKHVYIIVSHSFIIHF